MTQLNHVVNSSIPPRPVARPRLSRERKMPKKNIALLKRLRTRFLRMQHPEHLNMGVVAAKTECGAAMCLIGHVLDLCGYKMRLKPFLERDGFLDFDFIEPNGRVLKNDPQREAVRLLGIGGRDNCRNDLFMDYSITTPKKAAARIEQLIAES